MCTPTPVRYVLEWTIDVDAAEHSGRMTLHMHVDRPCSVLALHAHPSLEIRQARIDDASSIVERAGDRVLFRTAARCKPKLLTCRFWGRLSDVPAGVFVTLAGRHPLVTTHLEPDHARRLFPCVDHPAFRAVFEFRLRVPRPASVHASLPWTVLSNMPLAGPVTDGWHAFQPTPPMPAYLIGVVAGTLMRAHSGTVRDVDVHVWKQHDDHEPPIGFAHAHLFLARTLRLLRKRLGMSVGVPKLDFVPVTGIPMAGMESWGLITARRSSLALSGGELHMSTRYLLAHELAHQWFGNTVTCGDWAYLWLNEGVATYAGLVCLGAFVGHKGEDWFLASHGTDLVFDDAVSNAPPIEDRDENPRVMFRTQTYTKAALVLRMMGVLVGAESMWHILRAYVQRCAHRSVMPEEFWSAVDDVTGGGHITALCRPWFSQRGMPFWAPLTRVKGLRYGSSDVTPYANVGFVVPCLIWPCDVDALAEADDATLIAQVCAVCVAVESGLNDASNAAVWRLGHDRIPQYMRLIERRWRTRRRDQKEVARIQRTFEDDGSPLDADMLRDMAHHTIDYARFKSFIDRLPRVRRSAGYLYDYLLHAADRSAKAHGRVEAFLRSFQGERGKCDTASTRPWLA